MKYLCKCPYCKDGKIEYESKEVLGRKTKVYTCSNAKFKTEDGDVWEATEDSKCSYRIWGSGLLKYGKRFLGPKEVKAMIENKEAIVILHARGTKKEYKKYIVPNLEYGFEILFDIDIEED